MTSYDYFLLGILTGNNTTLPFDLSTPAIIVDSLNISIVENTKVRSKSLVFLTALFILSINYTAADTSLNYLENAEYSIRCLFLGSQEFDRFHVQL